MKHHAPRQHPENPDETAKEERSLQETNAEIGRKFRQMTGILVDALVRVSADLSGIGQAKCAPGFKPLVKQITHEPFAQVSLVAWFSQARATFTTKRAPATIQKTTS